jgi:hypothetical protein
LAGLVSNILILHQLPLLVQQGLIMLLVQQGLIMLLIL